MRAINVMRIAVVLLAATAGTATTARAQECRFLASLQSSDSSNTRVPRPTLSGQEYILTTEHFKIHYTTQGEDSTTTSWADTIRSAAEYSWSYCESPLHSWPLPPADSDGFLDIYVLAASNTTLDGNNGVCNWESDVPPTEERPYDHGRTSWIAVRKDSVPQPFPKYVRIRAVVAHEFHHAIQNGYNGTVKPDVDGWFNENCSVWFEHKVYPELSTLPWRLSADGDSPLRFPHLSLQSSRYSGGLWPTFLTEAFGEAIVHDTWHEIGNLDVQPNPFEALENVLSSYGGLSNALHQYAVWRYFTGARNDGLHFQDAGAYTESPVGHLHASYPASGTSEFSLYGKGGTEFEEFREGRGQVQCTVFMQQQNWHGAVIERRQGQSPVIWQLTVNPTTDTGTVSVSWTYSDPLVLVIVNTQTDGIADFSYQVNTPVTSVQFANKDVPGTDLGGRQLLSSLWKISTDSVTSGSSRSLITNQTYSVRTDRERFTIDSILLKHKNWRGVPEKRTLADDFLVQPFSQYAIFAQIQPVTLKAVLLDDNSNGQLMFRDPWYLNSNGGQPDTFGAVASPFSPSGAYDQSTGGVFVNQDYSIPDNPYYSVRALLIEPNMNGLTGHFQNWSFDTSYASLGQPESSPQGYDQKAVVFKQANAIVTAKYKAHLGSSLSTSTGSSNQRKLLQDRAGYFHFVYESAGEIWYTHSTDNGSTWNPEAMISAGTGDAHSPSIAELNFSGDATYVVWVAPTTRYGASGYDVYARRLYLPSLSWSASEAMPDARAEARPAVAMIVENTTNPNAIIMYEGVNTGIKYSYKYHNGTNYVWITQALPGTSTASCRPSVSVAPSSGTYGAVVCSFDDGSAVSVITSATITSSTHTPSFPSWPVDISSGGATNQSLSSISADRSGKVYVSWKGYNPEIESEVTIVRSRINGTWTTPVAFSSDIAEHPQMTSSVSTPEETAGASLIFTDGVVLFDLVSTNGLDWTSQEMRAYEGYSLGWPNQSSVSSSFAHVVTKQSGSPHKVFTGVFTNQGLGKAVAGRLPTVVALSRRLMLKQADNVVLVELAAPSLVFSGRIATPVKFDRDSISVTNRIIPANITGAVDLSIDVSVQPRAGNLDTPLRFNLIDVTSGDLISTLGTVRINGKMNRRMVFGIPQAAAQRRVAIELSVDEGLEVSMLDQMRISSATALQKGESQLSEGASVLPSALRLSQNYPNPFNPSTTVSYDLPTEGHVTLAVYDGLGRLIATLADGMRSAGYHLAVWNAEGLSSAVYLARLSVVPSNGNPYVKTIKMSLLK